MSPSRRAAWNCLLIGLVLCGALWPVRAQAQLTEIRGTVVDGTSQAPLSGAVVMLIDASGATLTRTLASARGIFQVLRVPTATHVRVVRMGYAPATVALSVASARAEGPTQLDVSLVALPRALEQVTVAAPAARGCETRVDHMRSLALLDAARTSVLAAVVANESDPPQLTVLRFDRVLDATGQAIVSQSVTLDSASGATSAFHAVHTTSDFLTQGFRTGRQGDYTYFGPDAAVLLDARFSQGYCFDVVPADSVHRRLVGVHFAPATRSADRVDIDGTLWIDTTTFALTELTFNFVGIDEVSAGLGAGGRIAFRLLPSGVTIIDQWHLRLIGAPVGTENISTGTGRLQIREVGGELAVARWRDGRLWSAPLGTVFIAAVGEANRPAPRAQLRLSGTTYQTVANAGGHAVIRNLLPGPYRIVVEDTLLRTLGLDLPTTQTFTASRGTAVVLRAEIDGPIELARTACRRSDAPRPNESWVLARILDDNRRPVDGVRWKVYEADGGVWKSRSDEQLTDARGIFAFCRGTARGRTIEIVATVRGRDAIRVRRVMDAPLVVVPITLPRLVSVAPEGTGQGTLTMSGTVSDSISGIPLADARVRILDTPYEGATDERGRFVVGGLLPGRYQIEVAPARFQRIGLVSRRSATLSDSTTHFAFRMPSVEQATRAACRELGASGNSLIVGRLSSTTGNTAAIAGYRVVVAWQEPSADNLEAIGFARVVPDPNSGTFRVCDVPVARPLTISAEADEMHSGSASDTLTLAGAGATARVDLMLDPTRAGGATWSGTIVADSMGTPVGGSEVEVPTLGLTVRANALGQFRIRGVPTGSHRVNVRTPGFDIWRGILPSQSGRSYEPRIVLVRSKAPDQSPPL